MWVLDGENATDHGHISGGFSIFDLLPDVSVAALSDDSTSRCAAKMAAPQIRHADSPFVSAGPFCGAGFQPAQLHDPTVEGGRAGFDFDFRSFDPDVQPRWPHHKSATLIARLAVNQWCGPPESMIRSPRCAAKMAAPQTRHADSPFVSAKPICGAGFQPAHLHDPTDLSVE